ncbi:hypothetical protein [Halomonas aquatica]|uniref:Uncharacterized protein n=1 Tax=Halomonas aquatica TaxID=3151123 RepID=A0ABV1NBM9_9GAMM
MSLIPTRRDASCRGATRRRHRRRLDWAGFDRWLDRVVVVVVSVALLMGVLALVLSLLI